jgi:hypothetical protein
MTRKIAFIVFGIISCFYTSPCWAQQAWEFRRTYESKAQIDSPFFLFATIDLNRNGTKELIITDFGRFGDHIEEWKQWKNSFSLYNLKILEWEKGELKTKFQKQWDTSKAKTSSDADRYFRAYESSQMVPWQVGDRVIVETIPPYLGIEWKKGKYVLREQQGWAQEEPLVGSWVFPWLSPSCYESFPNRLTWPRECLVGVRDFLGTGEPRIITILEDKIGFNQYRQTLRVKKIQAGFPTELELALTKRFGWWSPGWEVFVDRINQNASDGLLMIEFNTARWFFLSSEAHGKGYRLRPVQIGQARDITNFDLPDIYLRKTQNKSVEDYWGYRRVNLSDPKSVSFIMSLRKASLKPDLSGFVNEDIDFSHHDHFLGVGYFDLRDIDGDGLDEIILVEETAGKLTFEDEAVHYGDVKDYIHILKWDGAKYQTMWVSPPYTKRGLKFLIEDIKNIGKKQLVVLTPCGTVQIWERQ